MKTKSKCTRRWLTASCFILALLAISVPAFARNSTGYNSFHVSPGSAISCIGEYYGSVVNNCTYSVGLTFETVVDNWGSHTINVTNNPTGYGPITCQAVAYSGASNYTAGDIKTFNPSGQQTLSFNVYVNPGYSMSLNCTPVPSGRGIANINWNP